MDAAALIKLGSEAAEAFNKMWDRLPTHEQKQLQKFYDFLAEYNKEVTREDSDFDDLLTNRDNKRLMLQTFLSKAHAGQSKK